MDHFASTTALSPSKMDRNQRGLSELDLHRVFCSQRSLGLRQCEAQRVPQFHKRRCQRTTRLIEGCKWKCVGIQEPKNIISGHYNNRSKDLPSIAAVRCLTLFDQIDWVRQPHGRGQNLKS